MRHGKAGLSALAALAVLAAAAALSGCSRSEKSETLTLSGSTTLLTMSEAAGQLFEKEHPGVRVLVQGGGSSAGIEDVSHGASDIGTSSRDLADTEKGLGLVDHPVAIDAICIIEHPDNPVSNLTTDQVRAIFKGRVANWNRVGGANAPVLVVNRDEASGTREAFSKKVLDKQPFDPHAAVLPGTGQVRSFVASAPDAIGYISVGFVTDDVKAVSLAGVAPTRANVVAKKYGLSRTLHYFTKGEARGLAKEFIAFVLSPRVQKEIVSVEFVSAAK